MKNLTIVKITDQQNRFQFLLSILIAATAVEVAYQIFMAFTITAVFETAAWISILFLFSCIIARLKDMGYSDDEILAKFLIISCYYFTTFILLQFKSLTHNLIFSFFILVTGAMFAALFLHLLFSCLFRKSTDENKTTPDSAESVKDLKPSPLIFGTFLSLILIMCIILLVTYYDVFFWNYDILNLSYNVKWLKIPTVYFYTLGPLSVIYTFYLIYTSKIFQISPWWALLLLSWPVCQVFPVVLIYTFILLRTLINSRPCPNTEKITEK